MKSVMRKQEAADLIKVSAPTFKKFLKKHAAIVDGFGMVNIKKLDGIITKESRDWLSKKGKLR